ncbi:MAG: YabP/YqfC family sporulation protein [Clostridia bacterium]|nr:YabP/YqfC family sporulation protein [Clostridia bacterium]
MKENQTITLTDRAAAEITGVEEVLSYDESSVRIQTALGQLTLDGEGLNVVQLDLGRGIVSVEGHIDAFYYMEQKGRRSLFSRILG